MSVTMFRWWKNGDHPCDRVGNEEVDTAALLEARPELLHGDEIAIPDDAPTYVRQEGAVVRWYRLPGTSGTLCDDCGEPLLAHGWIDDECNNCSGHKVCPGSVIVIDERGHSFPADVGRLVREAVGRASACWERLDRAGVFDSDRALDVSKRLVEALGLASFWETR